MLLISLLLFSALGSSTPDTAGWLGVVIEELSPAMRVALGIEGGVLISRVIEGSPADQAGLHIGDVITDLDRIPVESGHQLQELVRSRPGRRVALTIRRRHEQMTVFVRLGIRRLSPRLPDRLPLEPDRFLRDLWHRFRADSDLALRTLDSLQRQLEELLRQLRELQRQLQERG